ncbi:tRNA (guanosine(37)-N1)-methyltransferase TrmD [Malaciobacter marinus]|uniref:tRNA (guanine-N(1)-)-methyltransferase n=1 Tax=Malaciobacter marinus TaxID=505249 RepID=A0A347THU3_9BACT|nr:MULTISPECIES: tRNA (guanosine(37)-N1)-methyltransferase TrmD [Malaciobacter]AXX86171.1 tRNA m1G37 methyltransferase [Malaciobacter marinus]PHO13511.1 tRNA (guanosine(37)-N1)-methyltransferase TrmD [Malaciobacter marinus]PHO14538.1 tRNA (guanosine(37)-N1)-methyltransferase TrmD [Malaciobacter marinus]RYA23451.1 tRNA (guanosine(37)-N1)-methyltransferase TrmD [Malaciobacter halophilus]
MKFTYVTLFPNLIEPYFYDSILKRAVESKLLNYEFYNPRDFTKNKHNKVDKQMVGGGAGMLMTPQPLFDCLDEIKRKNKDAYIIFPLAAAKPFRQNDAKRLAKKKNIVFVSGRYEGIDERVCEKYANEVFSIGEFVLTGGELPSLVMSDAISRNLDNVLGNAQSLDYESYEDNLLEAPSFTKPEIFQNLSVIKEFLKGNHSKISDLKFQMSICKTKYYRPNKEKR